MAEARETSCIGSDGELASWLRGGRGLTNLQAVGKGLTNWLKNLELATSADFLLDLLLALNV